MIGHEGYWLAPVLLIYTGYRRLLESYAMAIRAMTISTRWLAPLRIACLMSRAHVGPDRSWLAVNTIIVSLCLWPHRVHTILASVTTVQPLQETPSSGITTARQPKKHLPS